MPAFLTAKNLKPFIPSDLYVTSSQIEFRRKEGGKAFGHRLCDLLTFNQVIIGERRDGWFGLAHFAYMVCLEKVVAAVKGVDLAFKVCIVAVFKGLRRAVARWQTIHALRAVRPCPKAGIVQTMIPDKYPSKPITGSGSAESA